MIDTNLHSNTLSAASMPVSARALKHQTEMSKIEFKKHGSMPRSNFQMQSYQNKKNEIMSTGSSSQRVMSRMFSGTARNLGSDVNPYNRSKSG